MISMFYYIYYCYISERTKSALPLEASMVIPDMGWLLLFAINVIPPPTVSVIAVELVPLKFTLPNTVTMPELASMLTFITLSVESIARLEPLRVVVKKLVAPILPLY